MLRGTMFFAKEFPDDEIDKILETYLEKKEQGIINRFQSKPGAKDA
jgi:hypothetical protein